MLARRRIANIDPVIPEIVVAPIYVFDPVSGLSTGARRYNAGCGDAGCRDFSYHLQRPWIDGCFEFLPLQAANRLHHYGCYKVKASLKKNRAL